jgi:hypothetical protein
MKQKRYAKMPAGGRDYSSKIENCELRAVILVLRKVGETVCVRRIKVSFL